MNIIENLLSAVKSVMGNKMRSLLTMLGIIIGIASVIMIMSVGEGVKGTVFSLFSGIDKRMVQVYPISYMSEADYLTFDDMKAIRKIQGVKAVTATNEYYGFDLELLRDDEELSGSMVGVDENYGAIETYQMKYGRFISENDVANNSRVAVLRPYIAAQVFGYVDCVGEKITFSNDWMGKQEFPVIGVLEGETELSMTDMMLQGSTPLNRGSAVIPISTLNEIWGNEDYIDFIAVSLLPEADTKEISSLITTLLDRRHSTVDNYRAESLESMFAMIETVLGAITAFIAFVAGISLFVGGVGVMNIMLVSVKERTREIGIRKALGATEGNIKTQFLFEAITLSLIGGVIGIIIGYLLSLLAGGIITSFMDVEVVPNITVNVIILACSVSTIVGIIFGVYPAGKAAKLDPIEALRYE